jgi:hypothetical protein
MGASSKLDRATRASPEPASGLGHSASVPSADKWAGRLMIRCTGYSCKHSPGSCTADPEFQAYMQSRRPKPDYVPAHKQAEWLSSADVFEAIRELAGHGVDKAACWDFTLAIHRLVDARIGASAIEARRAETQSGSVHESAVPKAGAQ